MIINRYGFLFLVKISLLICITGCKRSCDRFEQKLVNSLLEQMTLHPVDDGSFSDSKCLYAAKKILQQLTEYEAHTKYGHWGEYYEKYSILKSDSLMYDSILAKLTKEELRKRIMRHHTDVTEAIKSGCLKNLQTSDCKCYLE